MPRIKGTALRGILHYLKRTGGDIPGVLALLPASSRKSFDSQILVSDWYPHAVYLDLLEAIARHRNEPAEMLMPQVGRWLATEDVGFLFKFVTTFASIETLARRCPLFWKQHCDQGTLETTFIDANSRTAKAVIKGVPGMRAVHCGIISGWVEGMAQGAGAQGMRVWQVECAANGAAMCRFEGAWDE